MPNCILFDGKIYYIKTPAINKKSFLKYMGVEKRSYMGNVFTRLFDGYCKNSINLYSEYELYYKKEFNSFDAYLEKKHNLTPKEIFLFNNKRSYYKEYINMPERNIDNLITFDDGLKREFYTFLGGVCDED